MFRIEIAFNFNKYNLTVEIQQLTIFASSQALQSLENIVRNNLEQRSSSISLLKKILFYLSNLYRNLKIMPSWLTVIGRWLGILGNFGNLLD